MEMEITLKELGSFLEQGAQLIDVRDELSFSYGNIGGSVNIPLEQLKQSYEKYRDQKLVLYCKKGEISLSAAEFLQQKGIEAYSLKEGYLG